MRAMNTPTPADDPAPIDPLPPVPLAVPPEDAGSSAYVPPPDPPRAETAPPSAHGACANCGAPLFGPHCYACGQPVKGMVRHLSSIMSDVVDTILNIDSRIFRTLFPLYFRPGFLTNEYFDGRRVRYVTPFRLYFFLSVLAFFLMQIALDADGGNFKGVSADDKMSDAITQAQTAEALNQARDAAIAQIEKAESVTPAVANKGLEKARQRIQQKADKRLEYLKKVDEAKAKGEPAPADPNKEDSGVDLNGTKWDPQAHPVHLGGPKFLDDKVNQMLLRARDNLRNIGKDPKPLILGAIGCLPQVLFVLMPLFALMLKFFYIFKRRLYMEHLIVALHSHAFIYLSLLLLTLAGMAKVWAEGAAAWLVSPLDILMAVMGWWLPIYLFLMQKKVYKQGWVMTTFKYGLIGTCYTVLISFCAAAAFLVSLATYDGGASGS
jgi:hypothetical protein